MGSTITEKIIAAHCGKDEVKPGQLVNASVDLVMINDLMGAMTFKIMERRLLRGIMNPAMILAWAMGLVMVFVYPAEASIDWTKGWVHTKALAVILMTVLHHRVAHWRKDFAADANKRTPRFYKFWNEMPAVLMVVIVIMVIGKPF